MPRELSPGLSNIIAPYWSVKSAGIRRCAPGKPAPRTCAGGTLLRVHGADEAANNTVWGRRGVWAGKSRW